MAVPAPRKKTGNMHYPIVSGRQRQIGDDDYRLLIPAFIAPKIIGSGGANIKKIGEAAKAMYERARVMIYHDQLTGEPLMEGSADRILGIRASPEALENAITMLIPLIQMPRTDKEKKVKLEMRIVIPFFCCAALVGIGGKNLKEIQEETGSFVQIYKESLPHSQERLVRIQHFEADALCITAMKIWKSIAPFKKEQPLVLYEPIWFEPGTYGNTGSWMDTRFFNAHGVFSKTPYVGPPLEEAPKGGARGGLRGGFRGAPRDGPRGGFRGGPRGGFHHPVYDQHFAEETYAEEPYEEDDACMDGSNIALDAFEEKPAIDTDQYADAIAKGIAIGMKQAISMGLVAAAPKSTPRGVSAGSRGAGPMRAGYRGGRAASAGFRSAPYSVHKYGN